ncbi:cyanophycin synthetase [Vreelandella janggokensis]|uniref:Cyanophycin synthetase n=1 Tax=Vreelandella janggokensis TaxID=370767 RepID=A0ABT4IXH2_9GAMM|nr:cyanophycin synthetase [Halomonas janggokensis]MCZ0927863.1 cyanophycin synthetase [Halomonas janggokensis]MCZ0930679.1 cyanophycin synthetase [Halomonas janggokensis]MDR5884515.1 cyanophycin synthetase [Halomonas janggokensis]
MNIIEHRALRGPNYYSRYPAIFMRLDIGELEERPSDLVPGIVERLTTLLPTLQEHRCSIGRPGGFLARLERGTWAGHVVEHVAIELQNLIGFSVGYGKTVDSYETGIYNVVYRYRDEACGLAAGVESVDLVERLFRDAEIDLPDILERLRQVRDAHMLGPSTAAIVNAATQRGIPHVRLSEENSYIQFGHGHRQQRIQATVTGRTGLVGYGIADDKEWTKQLLGDAGIPVPKGQVCGAFNEALDIARGIGYPVAVKPVVGNHGRGVSTNIEDDQALSDAFDIASLRHPSVIVEQYIRGEDHRLLVIDGKLVAAARRRPAHVVGDGVTTLQGLVDKENRDPRRGIGHENLLTQIQLDDQSLRLIGQQNLTLQSVIPAGDIVYLKPTANLSTGGTATDVTDDVHPEVRYVAERIARLVGLDIIGIDLLAETLTLPLEEQSAAVVEVNAGPGFRMHLSPTHGEGRDVGRPVIDMLFPDSEATGRIPIAAVTGTNGKTTTVRLLSHLLRQAGRSVGMACTGTIEIDNHVIMRGDYSGPQAAAIVLREPTVECAVLEVARGGIMRRGLGFDECDVGVLLNIASDHLGEHDIHTLDELARCKTVVIDAVRQGGTAVLNADDLRVLEGQEWARGDIIFFTLDPHSRPVRQHVREQGIAFTVHNERIVMRQGHVEAEVIPVVDVPITFEGHARFNVANALAASAAAYALGLSIADIQRGLQTFHPTPGQNPGRTNLIDADGMKVLIDYGHNVPALEALSELVGCIPARRRISVASAPGNRRDEDLFTLGTLLARMHDVVFIYETDARGRTPGDAARLLREGAESIPGDCRVEVIMEEQEAVDRAFNEAGEGDLLVLLIDDVEGAIERIRGRRFQPAAATTPDGEPT